MLATLKQPRIFHAVILAVLMLFILSPIVSIQIAELVSQRYDCVVHEGFANPCIINGKDYGELLYSLFVAGWFFMMTIPLGIGMMLLYVLGMVLFHWRKQRQRAAIKPPAKHPRHNIIGWVYVLQYLGVWLYITWPVVIIVLMSQWRNVQDSWLASHFRAQRNTLLFYVLGISGGMVMLSNEILLGGAIVIATTITLVLYRILIGWLRFIEGKTMEEHQPNSSNSPQRS